MGKLGRWIDGLSEEQKDRVVRARVWGTVADLDNKGEPARCIVSHAEGFVSEDGHFLTHTSGRGYGTIGSHFDLLCYRFGLERIVRACKLRAAKGNDKLEVEIDLNEMSRADAEPELQSA